MVFEDALLRGLETETATETTGAANTATATEAAAATTTASTATETAYNAAATETTTSTAATPIKPTADDELNRILGTQYPKAPEPGATTTTQTAAQPDPGKTQEQINAEFQSLIDNDRKYKDIQNSEFYKLYAEFSDFSQTNPDKADIFDFFNTKIGVDPNSMSPDQLWEMNLKSLGLKGDELETEMAEFKELAVSKQVIQTAALRKQLEAERQGKLKTLPSYISKQQTETVQQSEEKTRMEGVIKAASADFEQTLNGLEGKKVNFVKITKELMPLIAQKATEIISGLSIKDDKGRIIGVDNPKLIELAVFSLDKDLVMKEYTDHLVANTTEDFWKKIAKPSASDTGLGGSKQAHTDDDDLLAASKGIFGKN